MKKTLHLLVAIIAFLTLSFRVVNIINIEDLISKIEWHTEDRVQEKVYIHTDKPYYVAGETLWLQGYVVEASSHYLDSLSRILYVDWVAEGRSQPIASARFKIDNGGAMGYFQIPDTLQPGTYQLRAYTNWMRNFDDEFFYTKHFEVIKNTNTVSPNTDNNDVHDLAILPEGGNLIHGIENIVAFKATNVNGKGVEVKGHIIANGQDTVIPFYSQHLGMGTFVLKPEKGKSYSAVVKTPDGKTKKFNSFPQVQAEGYTMSVNNFRKDNIRVKIAHNIKSHSGGDSLYVIAQLRGKVMASAKVDAKQTNVTISIPKEKITADGVMQITLFDNKGIPKCERLVFIDQNKRLQMTVESDKTVYQPREKVNLTLTVKDGQGNPIEGQFSMSVVNKDAVDLSIQTENILSYMLLSSDVKNPNGIKGFIENPLYYFDKNNKSAIQHLDLLLMTQGWRRYTWQEVLADKHPAPTYYIETGLGVSGIVLRPNGKKYENAKVTIFATNKIEGEQIFIGQSDNAGKFNFSGLDFTDSTDFVVQVERKNEGKDLKAVFDKPASVPHTHFVRVPYKPIPIIFKTGSDYFAEASSMIDFNKQMQTNDAKLLETVEIKAKKNERRDNRKGIYSRASNTYKVEPNTCLNYTSVFQMMISKFPGVSVLNSGGDWVVQIRAAANLRGVIEPLYMVDGFVVNKNNIANMLPCDVESIDILKGPAASIYGSQGGGGVINILTKQANPNYDYTKDPSPGLLTEKRQGYTLVKQFYSPDYSTKNPNNTWEDYRHTLYWQPTIVTNKEGRASVTFYNSDDKASFRAIVEGIGKGGLLGAGQLEYVVR